MKKFFSSKLFVIGAPLALTAGIAAAGVGYAAKHHLIPAIHNPLAKHEAPTVTPEVVAPVPTASQN